MADQLEALKAKLVSIIDEYKTVSKTKAAEFLNVTKDREGDSSAYKNQRDNPVEGDVTCNVTSLAMQLIKLANGDETKVRTQAVQLCQGKGIKASESTELEEMLRQLSIAANGGKKQIDGNNCYMYPYILNAVAKMFTGLVNETHEVFGAGVVTDKNIEDLKKKLKAELDKGAALRSSSKLTHGGHIVAIVGYQNDGLIIDDPYGARMPSGYIKNGDSAGNAQKMFNESAAATRFKHSSVLSKIKDAIARGTKMPSNVGEKCFYTWAEVDTYDIGRNVQAMSGNIGNVQANPADSSQPAAGGNNQPATAAKTISDTVGENGKNKPEDVMLVKTLLNKFGAGLDLKIANCGPKTIEAIKDFQSKKAGIAQPDGLISPNGKTWKALNGEAAAPAADTKDKPADKPAEKPAAKNISDTVGENGKNIEADVMLVKELLNKFGAGLDLKITNCGPKTIEAIKKFQTEKAGLSKADGLISPGGKTWKALNGETTAPAADSSSPATDKPNGQPQAPAEQADLKDAYAKIAAKYGVEPAVVYAIQSVESGGQGFMADGRPKILFEPHVFWSQLKKAGIDPNKHVKGNEDILYQKWGTLPYGGSSTQYPKLERAMKIDKIAALKSASWGEFQIMGFNHQTVGYPDVESFVEAMKVQGSTNGIDALMKFLDSNKLLRHVKGDTKNWAALAEGYNGPGYKKNQYDTKLAAAYAKHKGK